MFIYIREEEIANCESCLWWADLNVGGNCAIPTNYVKDTLGKTFVLGSSLKSAGVNKTYKTINQ